MATCLVCGGEARQPSFPYETQWGGHRYTYRWCAACGSTSIDPVPSAETLKRIYSWQNYHLHHYVSENERADYRRPLRLLRSHVAAGASLMDFGCGAGGFLTAAQDTGLTCVGIEYEEDTIRETAARTVLPVMSLEDAEQRAVRVDVIYLRDVLPHLPDPYAGMRRLEALLKPAGLFLFDSPLENNDSLVFHAARLLKRGRRTVGLDREANIAPTMLFRTNRKGQRALLMDRLGYREIHFEIYETGWPYFVAVRRSHSPGILFKQLVGRVAITLSDAQPVASRTLGNRFLGLYTPARTL